jgi:SAM-dependent methyltransferase
MAVEHNRHGDARAGEAAWEPGCRFHRYAGGRSAHFTLNEPMAEDIAARAPHANLDRQRRAAKARKIVYLLRDRVPLEGANVLEIGTGSGVIGATLKDYVGSDGEVWTVDVVDQRLDREALPFRLVTGTKLPFDDDSFDFVVSNHVVEHVGRRSAQEHHIGEIARVLRPGGSLYLATPNRFAPIEPHFKLPFLSWLPEAYRSRYVRAAHRGAAYDCRPLTRRELAGILDAQGLEWSEFSREAIRAMLDLERPAAPSRALLHATHALFPLAHPILPTFVVIARKKEG